MNRDDTLPLVENCIERRLYKVRSRNLKLAVYKAPGNFIGIRKKFDSKFLFTEYHYDTSENYGTVAGVEDTKIDLPNEISLLTNLGTVDSITGRPVKFDKLLTDSGLCWYFTDTGEIDRFIIPTSVVNKELFRWLDDKEKELLPKEEVP